MSPAAAVVRVVITAYGSSERLLTVLGAIPAALAGLPAEVVVVLAPGDPAAASTRGRGCEVRLPESGSATTPGANRNLGALAAAAPYLAFVDGDVELAPGFVRDAVARLEEHPEEAGTGARLDERQWRGLELVRTQEDIHRMGRGGSQEMLAAAWVVRRAAFEAVGGFDPALPSEEDMELCTRLRSAGCGLSGLDRVAGVHHCPPRPTLAELARRWRSGLFSGQGLVLRRSWGSPAFTRSLWRQRLYLGAVLFALAGVKFAVLALFGVPAGRPLLALWLGLAAGALSVMAVRKRSLGVGALSLLTWLVLGVGILRTWIGGEPRRVRP